MIIETSVEFYHLIEIFDYILHFFFSFLFFYNVIIARGKKKYLPNVNGNWSKVARGGIELISLYEKKEESLHIVHKESVHFPPHLHSGMEIVYVTRGTLALGVGCELYPMEKGDFAIVFPNLIHHYQVFGKGKKEAFYLVPQISLTGCFMDDLRKYCPKNPVIKKKNVHPDILDAIVKLYNEENRSQVLEQAYIQIILARSMQCFELIPRESFESDDIIYRIVSYIGNRKQKNHLPADKFLPTSDFYFFN